jgi:hypothetical protein
LDSVVNYSKEISPEKRKKKPVTANIMVRTPGDSNVYGNLTKEVGCEADIYVNETVETINLSGMNSL